MKSNRATTARRLAALALAFLAWIPAAWSQNCGTETGPIALSIPAAPTSTNYLEIGAGSLTLQVRGWSVVVDGFTINITLNGVLASSPTGPLRCVLMYPGTVAAGTYLVNLYQSLDNQQPAVSLLTSKQMVVADTGRPIWSTVLPTYPTPQDALSIRIRAATSGSPAIVFPHKATVQGDVIRVDGCVGDLGFAVPASYVVTVGVPALPAGRYRVEYHRGICRNDTGESTSAPKFVASFHLDVKAPSPTWPGVPAAVMPVSEYFHKEFDHYFITSDEREQVALDSGRFSGWVFTTPDYSSPAAKYGFWRTSDRAGTVPICRFFSAAFAPKSSHFYTASGDECEKVKANPVWTFEGIVGYVLPTPGEACADGAPLFRLYNNGQGGAPSHKYTTTTYEREYLATHGWSDEGVLGCVPVISAPFQP